MALNPVELKSLLTHVAKGFCMGAADVVPGVSGGTMALILGIYQRLVDAIRSVDIQLLKLVLRARWSGAAEHMDLRLLLPLAVGIGTGLMFFTRVVPLPELIRTQPVPVYSLFFGLIAASIVVLIRSIRPLRAKDAVTLALGVVLGFGVVNLVPTVTPEASWFIFISGALAICAMILPGISGSFILLILQKYAYVFDAIGRLDVSILLPFGLGAITGLLLFSRLLSWLLKRFYRATLSAISGLLIGSLWVIWPFQHRLEVVLRGNPRVIETSPYLPDPLQWEVLLALAFAAGGMLLVLALQRLSQSRDAAHGHQSA